MVIPRSGDLPGFDEIEAAAVASGCNTCSAGAIAFALAIIKAEWDGGGV
jgi:hypothetical protein